MIEEIRSVPTINKLEVIITRHHELFRDETGSKEKDTCPDNGFIRRKFPLKNQEIHETYSYFEVCLIDLEINISSLQI